MNIRLIAASDADDIQCKDGELVDADFLFRNPQEEGPGDSGDAPGFAVGIEKPVFSITAASRFLCIHRPPGAPAKVFAITVNHEGKIMYADAEKGSTWHTLSSGLPDEIKKCVAVGNFLVFLTPSAIHYAIFEGFTYRWLGQSPAPPELSAVAKPAPFPPYSYAAGELPVTSVSVGIGDTGERAVLDWLAGTADNCPAITKQAVTAAVRDKFKEFLFDLESSNLLFYPAQAVAFYRLPGGSVYHSSTPQDISPGSARVSLRIIDANCSGTTLFLTLEVSRAPFEVSCSSPTTSSGWLSLFEGIGFEVRKLPSDLDPDYISSPVRLDGGGRGFLIGAKSQTQPESFEEILADLSDHGVPDDIFSIGSRLLAVYRQGAYRPSNLISTSEVGWPQACTGIGKVAGAPLLHLTQSLRALSSGQFGEFPLYAFSLDGVRALTPSGGSFRDVQLISRHVPLGTVPFAPTPDATFFITKSGVMKIEGTTVSRLSKESDFPLDENSEIIYSYPDDAVLVKSADGSIHTCRIATGKWSAVSGELASFHYGWPDTWILQNGSIGILRLSPLSSLDHLSLERAGASVSIPIKTRPLKLGDPFTIKKLREAEVIWPNGARLGFRIYGAMQLEKWYFLGASSAGPMRMRGSGWRFFRVETYAIYVPGAPYLLPTLRLT